MEKALFRCLGANPNQRFGSTFNQVGLGHVGRLKNWRRERHGSKRSAHTRDGSIEIVEGQFLYLRRHFAAQAAKPDGFVYDDGPVRFPYGAND